DRVRPAAPVVDVLEVGDAGERGAARAPDAGEQDDPSSHGKAHVPSDAVVLVGVAAAVAAGSSLPPEDKRPMTVITAPTPATTNAIVEIVPKVFVESRSSCAGPGHRPPG